MCSSGLASIGLDRLIAGSLDCAHSLRNASINIALHGSTNSLQAPQESGKNAAPSRRCMYSGLEAGSLTCMRWRGGSKRFYARSCYGDIAVRNLTSFFTFGRWVIGIIGLFDALIWTREYFTRPDRDIWIDEIGSVVSLHSVYIGLAAVGVFLMLAGAWPVLVWLCKFPERVKAKRLEEERRKSEKIEAMKKEFLDSQNKAVRSITELLTALHDRNTYIMNHSKIPNLDTNILVMTQNLIASGVLSEAYRKVSNDKLQTHLIRIRPYIVQYGIKRGVAKYEEETSKKKAARKK